MKESIVKNHDYGYGKNETNLNKINLRNIDDLKEYIEDVLECNFEEKISLIKA